MRQPQAGCNAPSAIVTAAAQFIDIADATPRTCSSKPIDYSYSLGYHVSPPLHLLHEISSSGSYNTLMMFLMFLIRQLQYANDFAAPGDVQLCASAVLGVAE